MRPKAPLLADHGDPVVYVEPETSPRLEYDPRIQRNVRLLPSGERSPLLLGSDLIQTLHTETLTRIQEEVSDSDEDVDASRLLMGTRTVTEVREEAMDEDEDDVRIWMQTKTATFTRTEDDDPDQDEDPGEDE
jgi:hypothetical protein